ncbi:MAG TPA: OmpH family outer membrane protein [Gammaproteobacteria bacterium]|nr:OmpH family outer membrane protein [Gammaproteobacteria bacterium]
MKTLLKLGLLAMLTSVIAACNQQAANTTGVIDLARISTETGNAEKIDTELKNIKSRLKTELQTLQTKLQNNFQETQKKFGEKPTDEQRGQLAKLLTTAQQQLQQARNSAAIELQNKQIELITKLKTSVHKIAEKIAKKRGMTLILINNNNIILSIDEKIDLTDAVIAGFKNQGISK